jgi:hypothetical protein
MDGDGSLLIAKRTWNLERPTKESLACGAGLLEGDRYDDVMGMARLPAYKAQDLYVRAGSPTWIH